jgi:septal ring factor EnvC (AmiA/AmiB activator)
MAGPFIGFGNLVILEHGSNNYSLYGYLGTVGVERGQWWTRGLSSAAAVPPLPGHQPSFLRCGSTVVRSIPTMAEA